MALPLPTSATQWNKDLAASWALYERQVSDVNKAGGRISTTSPVEDVRINAWADPYLAKIKDPMSMSERQLAGKWLYAEPTLVRNPHAALALARMGVDPDSPDGRLALQRVAGKEVRDNWIWENPLMNGLRWGSRALDLGLSSIAEATDVFMSPGRQDITDTWAGTSLGNFLGQIKGEGWTGAWQQGGTGWGWGSEGEATAALRRAKLSKTAYWTNPATGERSEKEMPGGIPQEFTWGNRWVNYLQTGEWNRQTLKNPDEWYVKTATGMIDTVKTLVLDPSTYLGGEGAGKAAAGGIVRGTGRLVLRPASGRVVRGGIKAGGEVIESTARAPRGATAQEARDLAAGAEPRPAPNVKQVRDTILDGSTEKDNDIFTLRRGVGREGYDLRSLVEQGRTTTRRNAQRIRDDSGLTAAMKEAQDAGTSLSDQEMTDIVHGWAMKNGQDARMAEKAVAHGIGRQISHLSDADVYRAFTTGRGWMSATKVPVGGEADRLSRMLYQLAHIATGDIGRAEAATTAAMRTKGTVADMVETIAGATGHRTTDDLLKDVGEEVVQPRTGRAVQAAAPELKRFADAFARRDVVTFADTQRRLGWNRNQWDTYKSMLENADLIDSPAWADIAGPLDETRKVRIGPLDKAHRQIDNMVDLYSGKAMPLRENQAWIDDAMAVLEETFNRGGASFDDLADASGLDRAYVEQIARGLVDRGTARMEGGRVVVNAADNASLEEAARDMLAESRALSNDSRSIRFILKNEQPGGTLYQRVAGGVRGQVDNGYEAAQGLARDGDFAIISNDAARFLDGRGGRKLMNVYATARNVEDIANLSPDLPEAVKVLLAQAQNEAEVRSVLAQAIGAGEMVEYPFVGSLAQIAGRAVRPMTYWDQTTNPMALAMLKALNTGRHARATMNSATVALDNTEELLKQTRLQFDAARVPLAQRQEVYRGLLTATTNADRRLIMQNAAGTIIRHNLLETIGDRRTQKAWQAAAEAKKAGATLSRRGAQNARRWEAVERVAMAATRFFDDNVGVAKDYGMTFDVGYGMDGAAGAVVNGEKALAQDPAMLTQLAGRTMPMLDARQLARLSGMSGVMTRYVLAHPQLMAEEVGKGSFVAARSSQFLLDVAGPALNSLWKVSVLMRASYVTRQLAEEWQRAWVGGWSGLSAYGGVPHSPREIRNFILGVAIDPGSSRWASGIAVKWAGREGKHAKSVTGESLAGPDLSDPHLWRENMGASSGMSSVASQLDAPKGRRWFAGGAVPAIAREPGQSPTSEVQWLFSRGVANHLMVMSKDPVLGRLAGGWTTEEARELARAGIDNPVEQVLWWMRNNKNGTWAAKQLGGMKVRLDNGNTVFFDLTDQRSMRQLVEQWNNNLNYRTFNMPELRDAVGSGTYKGVQMLDRQGQYSKQFVREIQQELSKIDQQTLEKNNWHQLQFWDADKDRTRGQKPTVDVAEKFFHTMGDLPTDTFIRIPAYRAYYWQYMGDVGSVMGKAEKEAVFRELLRDKKVMGPTERDVLARKWGMKQAKGGMWEFGGGGRNIPEIGKLNREGADELARRMATAAIKREFYQHAERQHMFDAVRFIAPFAQPTWNSLKVLSKGLIGNPRALRRTQLAPLALQEPGSSSIYDLPFGWGDYGYDPGQGFFQTDTSGDTKFAYPVMGSASGGLMNLLGSDIPGMSMEGYASSLNIGLMPHPGLGPMFSWPASMLMPKDPQMDGIRNMLWPTVSEQRTGLENAASSLFPAWMNKMFTAFGGLTNGQKSAFAKRQLDAMAYLANTGDYDTSSVQGRAQMVSDAQSVAKRMFILETFQRGFAPTPTTATGQFNLKTEDGDTKTLRFLSDELWRMRDMTGDYTRGTNMFLDSYGDSMYFVGATGRTGVSGMASATNGTDIWLRTDGGKNMDFARQYPHVWGLFVPMDADPSMNAYNARARDMINQLGGFSSSSGAQVFDLETQMRGDVLFRRALMAAGLTESSPLKDRRAVQKQVEDQVPGWSNTMGLTLGSAEQKRKELIQAAKAYPSVASDMVIEYDQKYQEAVDAYRADQLKAKAKSGGRLTDNERDQAENASLDSQAASQYRWELLQWGDDAARTNPQFAQMWKRIFRKELV